MVFDSANEVVVLFGGDADGRNNETWFYNVASDEWTQLSLSISPPVRHDHSMVYDTANEVVVLFGGDADGRTNDTWTYSNALPSPTPIFDGIIVDINGNGNYTSIQAAIDNATAGETIRVWAGTYDEDIVVDKELDIIGNGSSTTVIDGGGGDAVVDIRASKVTLSGFNITNGSSGIDVNSHDNTLTDNVITNNIFYGIRFDSSNSNNLISGNLISDNDFGISFDSSNTDNTISDNNISNNEYNGIQFSSSNNNNTLSGNSIWNNYRGIVFDSSSNRNTISGNDISISARGIYFKSSNDNNTLSGNNISNSDYGISFVSSNNNNTLNGNNLSDNIIGIRFGYLNSHNTISKNTISINSYGVHLASANNSFNIVNVNNITGNINDGISSESLVNAEYNWWGDASGPGGDGPGNGDGINNASNIDYSPWLGRPVGTVPMEYRVDGFIVDINGNGDHTSIQAAIDNATAGETIRVWAGTYNENVVVDKALTLIGNGSAGTIIDGSDSGIVVELIADGVTLSGFNITNGSVQGIYVHSSNNLIQDNVIVANNENGIYLHRNADHNTITGNTIIWNEVFGIETYDLSDITIQDNTISNNRDGMRLRQTYDSVVAGNEVTHHEEEGIYLQITDNVTVMDNTVTNNNYGINLRDSSYAQITGNTASFNGDSGIYIGLDSHNNTIRENTCNNSTKAGIWIRGEGAINNTVENNDCSGNQLFSLSITSTHRNTLSNNTLTDNNIGIDIEWAHNNTIVNNTSTGGTKGILLHDSQNNTFIDSSFTDTSQYDIHLESGSVDNVLINSSFSTILCDATSSLAVKNYLTVKTVYQEAPFAGADVEVTDDTTVYASSHYGGSNAKTDAKGAIERLAVTDRHYEGSSTPMDVNSTLKVRYREWEEERSIDMSTSHTEVFEVELVGTIELETDKTIYQAEDRVTITGYYNGSHDRVDLTITKPDESVLVDDSLAVLNFDDFLTDGLVGHWPFDDGTALDSSGSEYHGTLYGEPGVVEGILGKGLHFDGDGDYGSTEKNITLTGKASRTMSAWINVGDRYDDGVTLIFEWGDHNPDRAGSALSYNYAQSSIIFRGNNEDLQSPQNSAPINAWHHVVFTYDGTTGRIFINGVESVNGTLDLNTTSTTMNIGNDPNNPDKTGWNRWFNGTMDDLRLFDRELTPQQVRDLYDHSLGNLPNFGYEFNLPIDTPTGIYTVRANTTDAQNSTTFEVVSADLPDLSIIAEDITFLPGSPYENATVTINATVRNLGDSAGLGNVSFYLGEPQGPVNLIDTVAIETPIPANGSKAVQVDWEKAVEGEHDIHVVIDNVLPTDSDLQNNEAFVSIDVIGYVLEVVTENDTYLPGERVDLNMTYDGGQSYATVKVKYPNGTVLLERVVQVNGLEEGLVGYWSFDEHTNVSVFDLTENDNDGSVTGANWTDGILGEALELDGANLGIEIPDSTSLDITGELTLEAWVRITNHDQPHTIFNKYNPPPSGATFILGTRESTGRVIFDINPDEHYKIGTTNLTDGQWHHVVGVFVPSTSLEIYVDGVKEEYTENVGSPPSAIDPNDRPLVIGRFFDGAMDELKIYNRALSEEEILVRYQKRAGSATFTLPLDAPAGNYSVRVNTTDAWASTSFEVKEPFLDLPDLWLTVDDIVFDPAKPLVNETIIVSANVHNTGSVDGSGWARYYDGDPDSGSQLIGQEAITVWSEDATNSSISWKPTQERLYTICVRVEEVVDGESDVDNNAACKTLLVGPRPDLAVFASNITWTPIEPHEGDVVTVKANVSNLALVAGKADVSLWLGDPDTDGELLGTAENVALEVGEYAMVNWTTWQPTQAGTYNLTVVIHNVEHGDANLTNNRANFTIEVLPHVLLPDLYVKAILLSDGNISQNERLEVTLRIGNNGSVAAGSFIVKFYIDGFMAHSHTVGTGVAPFGFADVIVEWPVDNASGAYEITVKLDAMGQVEEWDELNNEVTLDLRVKEGEGDQGWFADFSVPGWGRSVAVAVAVAGVMALAAAGMASYTSENRRWLLYMALLLPLLTKVRKEELEKPDKFKAGRLYQTIMLNPGINLAALRDVTGMANGTLIYHLDRLERGGEVRSHKQGQLRLFYPTEESVQQERDGGLRYMHRTQKRVLQLLMEVKEANQRIIATSLEMKQQLVSYHLRELMLAGHIKRRGFRGFYSYQIVGDIDPKLLDTR